MLPGRPRAPPLLLLLLLGQHVCAPPSLSSPLPRFSLNQEPPETYDDYDSDHEGTPRDPSWPCPYNASQDLPSLLQWAAQLWNSGKAHRNGITYGHCDTPFYEGDIFLDGVEPWLPADGGDDDPMDNVVQLWPGGEVPYQLDFEYIWLNDMVFDAMQAVQSAVNTSGGECIRFRKRRPDESDYVLMTDKASNCSFSAIGRRGGGQVMNIGGMINFIRHLLLHVLGLWHENNRPGRNETIEVIREHIAHGYGCFFREYRNSTAPTEGLEYDLTSVMHARPNIFSNSPENITVLTLLPRDPDISSNETVMDKIGMREYLSPLDIRLIQSLYNCSATATTTAPPTTTDPTTTPPTPEALCLKMPYSEFSYLPYPGDCHKFIKCWNHRASVCCCQSGLVFWPEENTCQFPEQVPCTTAGTPSECDHRPPDAPACGYSYGNSTIWSLPILLA